MLSSSVKYPLAVVITRRDLLACYIWSPSTHRDPNAIVWFFKTCAKCYLSGPGCRNYQDKDNDEPISSISSLY